MNAVGRLKEILSGLRGIIEQQTASQSYTGTKEDNYYRQGGTSNHPEPPKRNEICCFCKRSIRNDEINRIMKPGAENRPDPCWFYCPNCKRISEENITLLQQYEGFNEYAYRALERSVRKAAEDRAYEGVKKFSPLMTSQLAALWLATGDIAYKTEYLRRIMLCGLDAEKAEETLAFECGIITAFPRPEMLSEDFVRLPLINLRDPFLKNTFEYYQTHFEYPLSYTVKLSDEGEWHFWNSHERELPDKVWEEIYMLSDKNMAFFRPFAMNLIEHHGWTFENMNKFSRFEQRILDVYRWRKASPESVRIWME